MSRSPRAAACSTARASSTSDWLRLPTLHRAAEIVLHAKITFGGTLDHGVAEFPAQKDRATTRHPESPAETAAPSPHSATTRAAPRNAPDAPLRVSGSTRHVWCAVAEMAGFTTAPSFHPCAAISASRSGAALALHRAHPDRGHDRDATRIEVQKIALVHAPLHERGSIPERSIVIAPSPRSPTAETPAG